MTSKRGSHPTCFPHLHLFQNRLYLISYRECEELYGAEAQAVTPLQDRLTEIFVTGYTFITDAFPARRMHDGYHPLYQGSEDKATDDLQAPLLI